MRINYAQVSVNSKNTARELQKLVADELKLDISSWGSKIKKSLKQILIEKGIAIGDLGFKDEIGGVVVNLVKKEPEPKPEVKPELTPQILQKGALPKQTTIPQSTRGSLPLGTAPSTLPTESEPEVKQYMSEGAQAKLIKKGLNDLIAPLYISLGIVEPDEEEKEEEGKLPTAKKFRKDMDSLGDDINNYLIENQIKLPALLNHLAILLSVFMVLVLPVLKFKYFSSNQSAKPKFDESADDVEVKA